MISTVASARPSDRTARPSHPTNEPQNQDAASQKFRLAGIYVPSGAERLAMQARYEARITESQRPDGSLDLSALPPNPPAAIPIYQGEDGKLYVLGNKQGHPVAMPFKRTRDFNAKQADEGGLIDASTLRGTGHPGTASPDMKRAISDAATNVARQPGEPAADAHPSGRGGAGPSLGNQAVQAGFQALEGFAGQAMATMLAGGTFGQFASTFNLAGLGQMGLGQLMSFASSQLMSMWGVDDSSSMGEQVAKKLTQDVVGKLQGELMSEISSGHSLFDKGALEQFFTGVKPTKPQMPIARETDPTSHGGVLKSSAAKTFVNTLKPIRTLDTHMCPKCEGSTPHVGGRVREGNPTFVIEGQLASRLDHAAICAGVGMEAKATPPAADVFIGDTTVAVLAPPEAKLPGKEVVGEASHSAGDGSAKKTHSPKPSQEASKDAVSQDQEERSAEALKAKEHALLDKLKAENPRLYEELTRDEPLVSSSDRVEVHLDPPHTYLRVQKDGKTYIVEADGWTDSITDWNLRLNPHVREKDSQSLFSSTQLDPPAGMSRSEFAAAILAAGRNAQYNAGLTAYSLLPDGGLYGSSSNCNTFVRDILTQVGYSPHITIDLWPAPGLNYTIPPSPPTFPILDPLYLQCMNNPDCIA